jgi:LDH2 family malate/lactate/ureidoglycolate dehydrogenase
MKAQTASKHSGPSRHWRVTADELRKFAAAALIAAGTDSEPASSVADALVETSLRGVDSHGIRLLLHYVKVVQSGRINPTPQIRFTRSAPAAGIVDADHGFGHYASFFAIEHGITLARENGLAGISVINSSHFGAAGCYALRAAEEGFLAISLCNSDAFVLPHGGVRPFNGTNPIAFAAPVPNSRPLLVDMASSVVPWNRVQDLMNEGRRLPRDVAVDGAGDVTIDPSKSAALLPLGGVRFGYKGAALASMIEVLASVMTGMPYCALIPGMGGPDFTTRRKLGHYFIVIDARKYVSEEVYKTSMREYLRDLRSQPNKGHGRVLAPGDREWAVADDRTRLGIPIATQLRIDLNGLADRLQISRIRNEASLPEPE